MRIESRIDSRKFERTRKKSRRRLDYIMNGHGPKWLRIGWSFRMMSRDWMPLMKTGVSASQKACSVILRGERLSAKIGLNKNQSTFFFALGTAISGLSEYIAYHELGEIHFTVPLVSQVKFNTTEEVSISNITASDIYGDLFASTLSPLSPADQLVHVVGRNYHSWPDLTPGREESFYDAQKRIFSGYKGRENEGYKFGTELAQFYEDYLRLQLGFRPDERKDFLLTFYDTVQDYVWNKIQESGEINEGNLADILFDADFLLAELSNKI